MQDAFTRGLLKPGLNVVLEKPKKAVNDEVSSCEGPGPWNGMCTGAVLLGRPILVGKMYPCAAGVILAGF